MTPDDPSNVPQRFAVAPAIAGLLAGFVLVWLLPSSWIFVRPQGAEQASARGDDAAQYACPMFCVVMDRMPEGGKCPVCGMTMTVISGSSTLDRAEQHMVGLEADVVRRIPLVRTTRLVGEVDYDETRLARIATRAAGWLQTVWIDSTWSEVSRGEPLAALYSPEFYAAEQEYLVAWRAHGAATGSDSLLAAARRRLALLDVDPREIAALESGGSARDAMVLRAPFGGVVVERRAVEGAAVAKGATLYTVADLSRVWIQAQVFEGDLPWVRPGQAARLEIDGAAGVLDGVVAFVDPVIDRTTRTARVRVEVDNATGPDGVRPLRIGQRVDAWVEAPLDASGGLVAPGTAGPPPLAVPRSAVMRTGERSLIYVLFEDRDTAEGRVREHHLDPEKLPARVGYEAVEVRTGPVARRPGGGPPAEFVAVLSVVAPRTSAGAPPLRLDEGVTVVTRGNLLLDSQAQLAGRPSLLFPVGNRGAPSDPHAGH